MLVTRPFSFTRYVLKRSLPQGHSIFTKRQNFGCDQIEGICRQQIKYVAIMMISLFDRMKTLSEKEKMLVTSISSFSHTVFQPTSSGSLIEKSILCGKDFKLRIMWQRVVRQVHITLRSREPSTCHICVT